MRAELYRFLAGFLSQPPSEADLAAAAGLSGGDNDLGAAIGTFARIAAATGAGDANTEFHDLFIGVARGELLPFGSYYQTGFLNEKPLARLRRDMTALGIARTRGNKDPEDHISSVLEMMAGLIEGTWGPPGTTGGQQTFFSRHIDSWAPHFFKDLETAEKSVLYAPLGTVGRLFMDIERSAFAMAA